MATLETIQYAPSHAEVRGNRVQWIQSSAPSLMLPQICWETGVTWGEANLWALDQASASRRDIKTVARSMAHLLAYAKWLEAEGLDWSHFPARESERCLNRFRGALVRARDAGLVKPSTASQRMATVIRFYRWVTRKRLLSTDWPMWNERVIGIRLTDIFGLEHTMRVASTDLAIPNRQVAGAVKLEDGLLPVSRVARQQILDLSDNEASEELALMLKLGFLSGLRIGSITDLREETIRNAFFDPDAGWYKMAVGPKASPPVATKFGVSGSVPLLVELRAQILEYLTSTRRLQRVALASAENRNLVFLTRFGHPYSGDTSRAVNVEMSRLREAGKTAGLDVLRGFHFHRSRATFATELMRVALKFLPVADAVQLVRESCLHRDDATTLKYVRFIESTAAMAEAADAFTEAFMGLARQKEPTIG